MGLLDFMKTKKGDGDNNAGNVQANPNGGRPLQGGMQPLPTPPGFYPSHTNTNPQANSPMASTMGTEVNAPANPILDPYATLTTPPPPNSDFDPNQFMTFGNINQPNQNLQSNNVNPYGDDLLQNNKPAVMPTQIPAMQETTPSALPQMESTQPAPIVPDVQNTAMPVPQPQANDSGLFNQVNNNIDLAAEPGSLPAPIPPVPEVVPQTVPVIDTNTQELVTPSLDASAPVPDMNTVPNAAMPEIKDFPQMSQPITEEPLQSTDTVTPVTEPEAPTDSPVTPANDMQIGGNEPATIPETKTDMPEVSEPKTEDTATTSEPPVMTTGIDSPIEPVAPVTESTEVVDAPEISTPAEANSTSEVVNVSGTNPTDDTTDNQPTPVVPVAPTEPVEEKVESIPISNDGKMVFDKIGLIGLNGSNFNPTTGNEVKLIAKKLFEMNASLILDSAKGLGEFVVQGSKEVNKKVTVVQLKPYLSSMGAGAASQPDSVDMTMIVYSNYIERLRHLLKDCDLYIFFNLEGIQNIALLTTMWSISKMYEGQHKPVILYGTDWNTKLEAMKTSLGLTDKDMSVVSVVTNPDELMTKVKALENDYANKGEIITPTVVDRRQDGDEKEFLVN